MHRFITLFTLVLLLIATAACAPDNLDITPTPTATNTPLPTSTRLPSPTPGGEPTPEPTEVVVELLNGGLLETIIAAAPARFAGGAITWNRNEIENTDEDVQYRDETEGRTARIAYSGAGGDYSELTFGVFDSPEAAQIYYELIRGRLRTLENSETRDIFPLPNAFGGGTYGSDAIFVRENLFMRISVPRFSSTAGNPLVPYARALFTFIDPIVPPA